MLVGGGCSSSPEMPTVNGVPVNEIVPEEVIDDSASAGRVTDPIAFPQGTWSMVRGDGFALPLDESFSLTEEKDYLRIQNYDSQNDAEGARSDDAFVLEISSHTSVTAQAFTAEYNPTDTGQLGAESVLIGKGRVEGATAWPWTSYLNTERDVLIRVSYKESDGQVIADAILSHLSWE